MNFTAAENAMQGVADAAGLAASRLRLAGARRSTCDPNLNAYEADCLRLAREHWARAREWADKATALMDGGEGGE